MSQDFKEIGMKRCYACIQWDGKRTYYPEKKVIKVDEGSDGACRVTHKKTRGSAYCDQFFALK